MKRVTADIKKGLDGKSVYVLIFFAAAILMLPLRPFADDWNYLTSPQTAFDLSGLLPDSVFWRPLDALFGLLLGFVPSAFPLLNHVTVVFGHVLGALFLNRVLSDISGMKRAARDAATVFFLLSPGAFAAVASIDSLNQVWSSTIGIAAMWAFVKSDRRGARRMLLPALLCLLAALAKESGIVWVAVIPLLGLATAAFSDSERDKKIAVGEVKNTFAQLCVSAALCVIYFVLRFGLAGSAQLGGETGRYSLSLSPMRLLRNFAVLFGANFTAADSVSIFVQPRNYILIAVTAALSIPFVALIAACAFRAAFKKESRITVAAIALSFLATASPYLLLGSAGEMHAYQLVFMTSLVAAFAFNACTKKRLASATMLCIFFASLLTGGHKWYMMYGMGQRSDTVTDRICACYDEKIPPKSVAIVRLPDEPGGYSLYSQPIAVSAQYGVACRARWGYEYPRTIDEFTSDDSDNPTAVISERGYSADCYDAIWIVTSGGDCTVIDKRYGRLT